MSDSLPISGHTRTTCLLGSPVAHSASPALHNFSYDRLGLDVRYLVYDVKPDDLEFVIPALKCMGVAGANVTMPCKRAVIPYLDGLAEAAELEQAVNVIDFKDGKAIGYNTDGMGFMGNLRKHGVQVEGAVMTLMGCGGAGSAIMCQAALDGVAELRVFARAGGKSYKQGSELIERVVNKVDCIVTMHDMNNLEDMQESVASSNILANATSVGMGEDGNTDTPVPAEFLHEGLVVADACYHPVYTQLLRDAQERGCKAITGVGMMIEQAAESERIWFGVEPPVKEIQEKLFPDTL